MYWKIRGSIPGKRRRFFSFPKLSERLWTYIAAHSIRSESSVPSNKVVGAWRWPVYLILCQGYKWVAYSYIPTSPTCLHGLHRKNPLCYFHLILLGKSNVARMLHKKEKKILMKKCTERGPVGRLRRKWKFNMKRGLRGGSYGNKSSLKLIRTHDLMEESEIILVSTLWIGQFKSVFN